MSEFDPIVTVYESYKSVDQPHHRKLSKMLETFMHDEHGIESIRSMTADKRKEAKTKLPVVCFNGKFEHRNNAGLIESSGLMVLDFDDKDIKDFEQFEKKLAGDRYLYTYFVSTGGRGFKALARIPSVKNHAEYKESYYSFMERYPELDTSGKDVSRCCFYSFDPNIATNPNAKVWDKKHTKEAPVKLNGAKHTYNDYKKFSKVLNIIRYAQIGERNIKIYNASMLAGGYIAAGSISYDEALRLLEQEAHAIAPDEIAQSDKTIINGIKNGMDKPIEEIEELERSEDIESRLGKVYYTALDVQDEIDDLFENGQQKGVFCGLDGLDKNYSIKLGSTTYIYGAPFSGKSQLWFEWLIRLSEMHNWRHAVFSPETGSAAEIYAELIAMKARKDFFKDYNKQMSLIEMQKAKDWVNRHFIVIDVKDQMIDPTDFYDIVDVIERVYSTKIHTVTADPFNDFKMDLKSFNGRQDLYLESVLTYVRQNASVTGRHNCIITHVQDQQLQKDSDSGKMYYPMPTYRQIAGGQAWSRKGKGMIAVWRPPDWYKDDDGFPVASNESWVYVQKAKPKGVGSLGITRLLYNSNEHRYSDI